MPLKTHKVSVKQLNNVCMQIAARDVTAVSDEPVESGGTNKGLTPIELVLGSLGTCMATTTFIFAFMKGIKLDSIQVDVEGDINTDGLLKARCEDPTGYQNIRFKYTVKSSEPVDKVRQLIDFAEEKCPVGSTIRNSAKLTMLEPDILN